MAKETVRPNSAPLKALANARGSKHISRTQKQKKKSKRSVRKDYIGDSVYGGQRIRALTPEGKDSEDSDEYSTRYKLTRGPRMPKFKVSSSVNRNARDPFQCLDDNVVGTIISFLPASDTEILRRVSKVWKSTSEFHCGNEAIHRHFAHVGETRSEYRTRKEANLYFRRRLYFEEKIKAAKASKAIMCTSARVWHLNNKRLVWVNQEGRAMIRDLDRSLEIPHPITELDLRTIFGKEISMADILITNSGDLIVSVARPNVFSLRNGPVIARVSLAGSLIWKLEVPATPYFWGVLSEIGDEVFYRIERDSVLSEPHPRELIGFTFTVRSLEDGSEILRKQLPERLNDKLNYFMIGGPQHYRISITSGGRFAVLMSAEPEGIILDAATGEILFVLSPMHSHHIILGNQENDIWFIHCPPNDYTQRQKSWLIKYNPTNKDFSREPYEFVLTHDRPPWSLCSAFDPDRSLSFRLEHPRGTPRDLYAQLCINKLTRADRDCIGCAGPQHRFIEGNNYTRVTLPGAYDKAQKRKRRSLEAELPFTIHQGHFFGMVRDYLVYYSDEALLVVDFWPEW
ncbi:hypothetical protein MMC06_003840 [Schaereria dolodes]|nr:hypothetical protein [Schaereria dolodes]